MRRVLVICPTSLKYQWQREIARFAGREARVIVLTGTPLENQLEELISIVQFVNPHRLGPTWKLMHEHAQRDDTGRVVGYVGLDRIGQTLAPILIRRRKAEVLTQLPARTNQQVLVPMTELQAALHEENARIAGRILQRWRASGFLSESDQRRLTCTLQNMRRVCDSSYLLDPPCRAWVRARSRRRSDTRNYRTTGLQSIELAVSTHSGHWRLRKSAVQNEEFRDNSQPVKRWKNCPTTANSKDSAKNTAAFLLFLWPKSSFVRKMCRCILKRGHNCQFGHVKSIKQP